MGRSALFRSTDEQKYHARARRVKYNQSERYAECSFGHLTQHDTDDATRAKSLKKQYNRLYYQRKNGRKSSRQPQQTLPDANDVLPDRLLVLARSSSPSFRDFPEASHDGSSEVDGMDADGGGMDQSESYIMALRRYFSLEEQLDHDPAGQACRERRVLLQKAARDVVYAYEKMART